MIIKKESDLKKLVSLSDKWAFGKVKINDKDGFMLPPEGSTAKIIVKYRDAFNIETYNISDSTSPIFPIKEELIDREHIFYKEAKHFYNLVVPEKINPFC
ncbi:hypothetical protein GW932_00505 [archaeon]|nr:hypothetical protein [archaeon]